MKNNLFDLSGQVAFCCGGSSGLGLQFAKAMANAGADIALVARRTDRLDENAREIEAEYGVKVYPHYMDLQDSKSITDCVSDVVAHFGKIDILVNAAGIPGGGDPATLTDEYWLNVINTDLNGQFFTCREVVRQSMKPNQYGRIIMVSSIHGVCGRKGVDTAPYAAAKGGIASSVVLGIGRAIGEAMAIIMVAGNVANMPSLFSSVRFLTTGIAIEMNYASVGSLQRNALYSIGLVLFLFIMLINVFLNVCVKNRKEG